MPTRTQAHEGGTNVTIHIGIQFLILHLEYAFYNTLLHIQVYLSLIPTEEEGSSCYTHFYKQAHHD
jgi:hypothetical protein